MANVRSPAVAGTFYPGDAPTLAREVEAMLAKAAAGHHDRVAPKAIIAPHAGYAYSGQVAATAYARLVPARSRITRVVLLGPVHRVPVRGLALPGVDAFDTPLGRVPIDQQAIAGLSDLPQVVVSEAAHAREHSLEVHLPFLQRALDGFSLVPLAVGDATADQVAAVIDRLWGGDETLIVVSTDLSHYLPYPQAKRTDADTAALILSRRADLDHRQACGATPVSGLMLCARRHGLDVQMVDVRNSGDTAGPRDQVVGYGAFVLHRPEALVENAGATLIATARAAIARELGLPGHAADQASWLGRNAATFVTLTRDGALRGCIGSLEATRPLRDDVAQNAIAAAFRDPRFAPLTTSEWPAVRVEVSLLSALEPMAVANEAEAHRCLRPGVDGVVIRYGHHRGTFLPQVWETFPDAAGFLVNLRRKAGLPPDFWEPGMELSRYTVTKWSEPERPPA